MRVIVDNRAFRSKKQAMEFYLQGAEECDGAESERYFNIYEELLNGNTIIDSRYL